jgi:hypothetical protein
MREQGAFEALQDVASYIEDGTNSNGFTLWLRLKGSVQAEAAIFYSLVTYNFLGSTTPPTAFSFQIKIYICF